MTNYGTEEYWRERALEEAIKQSRTALKVTP